MSAPTTSDCNQYAARAHGSSLQRLVIQPFYDVDGITIYCGDCREIVPLLGRFDLLLTDPPYGLGEGTWDTNAKGPKRQWRLHHEQMGWDAEVADVSALLPVADKQIIWGGHLMNLPTQRAWLVWNKIVRNFSSGVCELAWTNLDCPIDAFDYSHGQLATEGKQHPTQKPLKLMAWCIGKAGKVQTILDPYMGSGTTLRAAKDLGLRAVGIEVNETYCRQAVARLAQGVLRLDNVRMTCAPEQISTNTQNAQEK
jgi:DNA modification methylase